MNLKLTVTSFLFILSLHLHAQEIGVDRKGKSVFTYYSKDDSRISVTADGNLAYAGIFNQADLIYRNKKTHDVTVKKFIAWNYQVKLTSEEDLLSSDKFSTLRPGLQFKLGRQVSIDTILHLDRNLPTGKASVKTYGYNIVLQVANIKLYDSIVNKESKKYPGTIGVQGNYNFIFRNRDTNATHRFILAFTGSLLNTYNSDELTSYQNLTSAVVRPSIVTMEDLEGKFGAIRRINDLRLSMALPVYFNHFNPIPYVVYNVKTYAEPAYYFGAFLNFLKPIIDQHSFQVPSTIGLGVDWKYSASKWSRPVFFIKGEVKI